MATWRWQPVRKKRLSSRFVGQSRSMQLVVCPIVRPSWRRWLRPAATLKGHSQGTTLRYCPHHNVHRPSITTSCINQSVRHNHTGHAINKRPLRTQHGHVTWQRECAWVGDVSAGTCQTCRALCWEWHRPCFVSYSNESNDGGYEFAPMIGCEVWMVKILHIGTAILSTESPSCCCHGFLFWTSTSGVVW